MVRKFTVYVNVCLSALNYTGIFLKIETFGIRNITPIELILKDEWKGMEPAIYYYDIIFSLIYSVSHIVNVQMFWSHVFGFALVAL